MKDEPEQKIRTVHCSRCSGPRNCDVRGHFRSGGGDNDFNWSVDWYIFQCRGCDYVFVQTASTDSESYIVVESINDQYEYDSEYVYRYWPALAKKKRPDWLTFTGQKKFIHNDLEEALEELYTALDNDLRALSAIAIRTAFDIASELLGIEEETFNKKIDGLLKAGLIGAEDRDRICADIDKALDVLEILCRGMQNVCSRVSYKGLNDAEEIVKSAIDNINIRFIENATGYQFSDGEIIRVDSQILHKEVMIPALEILRLPGFSGPQSEFLKAHEHYRHGRNAEAVNECHKSFESIMKAICEKRHWTYDPNKAASHLIDVCIRNNLLPPYQQNYMTGLRTVLESAVPTPRNKTAAHGAGTVPVVVPPELASYVIHLTASTLLFLANADAAKP